MCDVGIRKHYDQTEWTSVSSDKGNKLLYAWKTGKTGYPMVDAGMRELHETGWMNQSVRMVVASFLCEILNIDWRYGAKHFHQELVDADVSINAMMWQNAGRSGIDQWNFFMSPENASQDHTGSYTKRWIPELSNIPLKYLHKPWTAPATVLAKAGVILGDNYPIRVCLDINAAREKTTNSVLAMRRRNLHFNDDGGYDTIVFRDGTRSRVFTRKDLRLNRDGTLKGGNRRSKTEGKSQKSKRKSKYERKGNQLKINSFFATAKKHRSDLQTPTNFAKSCESK